MDALPRVSCPTLIVAGESDFLFPPQHQRELQRGISGSQLKLVPGAGHNAHRERPRTVVGLIARFVAHAGT